MSLYPTQVKRRHYDHLGHLRVNLYGFEPTRIADALGISTDRLATIEQGDEPPTADELDHLSRLYAIPPERLAVQPIELSIGDAVPALALAAEQESASTAVLLRILAAAEAARDLMVLQSIAGEDDRWRRFSRENKPASPPRRSGQHPHHEGRHYAVQLRRALSLSGPIPSMRDLIAHHFPSVAVLYAHLGRDLDLAGVTLADRDRGPTIILNLDGRNARATVRRFSLAHELCHLLVDWNRMEPIAQLSQYRDDSRLAVEQRANAFAARLLCPDHALSQLNRHHSPHEVARQLVERYGLHYGAARLSVHHATGVELPRRPGRAVDDRSWETAEAIIGLEGFPLGAVPAERRTAVAFYGALLYTHRRLSRREFAWVLRVDYAADVEGVVDHFREQIETWQGEIPPRAHAAPERQLAQASTHRDEHVVMRGEDILLHTPQAALARRVYDAAARRVSLYDLAYIPPGTRATRQHGRVRGRVMARQPAPDGRRDG